MSKNKEPEPEKEKLADFFKNKVLKLSNPDAKITKENIKNFFTPDPNFLPTYQGLIQFFPFYTKNYENIPDYENGYNEDITAKRDAIRKKIADHKAKFEDTFRRGKENIIEKRKTKEKYAREDALILDKDVKGVTGYITNILVASFSWFVNTTVSSMKNMLTTSWNKTITGFLILVFIILLIFVFPKMKKDTRDGGGAKKNRDMMSILLGIPQDISIAFSDFSIVLGDFTDTVNNTIEIVNNTATSMSAATPDLRDRGREINGRGGDNLFHIEGSYIKGTGGTGGTGGTTNIDNLLNDDKIYNIYKPASQTIKGQQEIPSTNITDKSTNKYKLDCSTLTDGIHIYVDDTCRLKQEDAGASSSIETMPTIDNTDYANIELD